MNVLSLVQNILTSFYRHKILVGKVSDRLKEICLEVSKAHYFIIEEIETDKDHVHMIINCNPRYGVMKCVQLIKSTTAIRLFDEFPYIKKRYLWGGKFWSRSSFVSTVGSVSLETVKKYLRIKYNNTCNYYICIV